MGIVKTITFLLLGIITTMMLMGADKSADEYVPDFQAISFKDIQIQDIQDTHLQAFLKDLSQRESNWPEKKTSYRMAEYDLNDDGTLEFLVYMWGLGFGGSGGDPLYILEKRDGKYNVIKGGIVTFAVDIGHKNPGGYRSIYFLIGGGSSRYYVEYYNKDGKYQNKEQVFIPEEEFEKYNIWYY